MDATSILNTKRVFAEALKLHYKPKPRGDARGGERGEEDIYSLKEARVADMKPKMIVLFEKVKSSLNLN